MPIIYYDYYQKNDCEILKSARFYADIYPAKRAKSGMSFQDGYGFYRNIDVYVGGGADPMFVLQAGGGTPYC